MITLKQSSLLSDASIRTLQPKKDVGSFKEGVKDRVYIARMSGEKRLMVFSFNFSDYGYAVIKDEKELNECFSEILPV